MVAGRRADREANPEEVRLMFLSSDGLRQMGLKLKVHGRDSAPLERISNVVFLP
jgi:hypothetical protein